MIYGDNHVGRTSETLDETADHEMLSYPPKHPTASRLVDSFSKSGVGSQDTDLLDDLFFR